MDDTAKIFMTGRSQAVRLPKDYRFDGEEVFIRRDPQTGDVILSAKPSSWAPFLASLKPGVVPDDFLVDREQGVQDRDPFEGYEE